jgi:hypothetical protein
MNHRYATIFALKTFAADATEIIDINVKDPISALILDLQVYNSAGGSMTLHPLACFTKIELVDGSDVLWSLTGLEAEALDWYNNKAFRESWNMCLAGNYFVRPVGINFGRYLWDPMFAFDPKQFKNPQLKVSMDINGGGLTSTYNKLAVHACCFDEKVISPTGFFMAKEIKNYTPTGAGHEYTDLPTDYPYRKLLVKCQTAGTEPGQLFTHLKLSEEQDKRVVFDHGSNELRVATLANWPPCTETYFFADATSARYLMVAPSTQVTAWATEWAQAAAGHDHSIYSGDGGKLEIIASAVGDNLMVGVQGWLPHGVHCTPFGDQNDPDDWYDVTKIGSLKADITHAAATGGIQLFLEQLRTY